MTISRLAVYALYFHIGGLLASSLIDAEHFQVPTRFRG